LNPGPSMNEEGLLSLYRDVLDDTPTMIFFLPRCSHTWELAPALEHGAEFPQFPDQGQSVGLLGRVISSSQGLYLYTNTEERTHIHRH
jgi:hypothetical protein